MPTRSEVAKSILDGHDENEAIAVSIFSVQDVLDYATKEGFNLTVIDAEHILEKVHQNQSAERGINWEEIDSAIREYVYVG